jgi:hypothetical protein
MTPTYSLAQARAKELECEQTILSAAKIAGWRRHGERPAQSRKKWSTPIKGDPGWPDLVLVRGPVMLCVELKRHPNTVDPEQLEWLRVLGKVPGVWALLVWVPEDMDAFNEALFGRHLPMFNRWRIPD